MYRDFLNIKHYLVELTQCFFGHGKKIFWTWEKNLLAYSLYLKIGDKEYKYEDLLKYRTNTEGFEVVYPNNGIFGVVDGGPSMAVADGYYIMLIHFQKGIIQFIISQV
jgi:hypothetical protein